MITINEQQFLIQLKRFEDMEVRGGQNRIDLYVFFLLTHFKQDCTTQRIYCQIPGGVQGEKAEMFRSLLSLEGCSFSSTDVLEAVQSCRDLPSALKYLCHDCPICQEQVSFNRVRIIHCVLGLKRFLMMQNFQHYYSGL